MAEKRRKTAHRMTGEEIAKHVFPPELHQQLKQAANPPGDDEPAPKRRRRQNPPKSP